MFPKFKKIQNLFLVGFFIAVVVPVVIPSTALAFGVSPASIELNNLKPDSEVQQKYTIMRPNDANAKIEERVIVKFDDSMKPYIKAPLGYELVFAVGQTKIDYNFTIEPVGLKDGTYKGKVVFQLLPAGDLQGLNLPALQANIQFTVNHNDFDLVKIDNVSLPKVNANGNLQVNFYLDNQGNVHTGAKLLFMNVTDKTSGKTVWSKSFGVEKESLTPPFTRQAHEFDTGMAMPAGNFKVGLDFQDKNGKSLLKQDMDMVVSGFDFPWKTVLISFLAVVVLVSVLGTIFHLLQLRKIRKRRRG